MGFSAQTLQYEWNLGPKTLLFGSLDPSGVVARLASSWHFGFAGLVLEGLGIAGLGYWRSWVEKGFQLRVEVLEIRIRVALLTPAPIIRTL